MERHECTADMEMWEQNFGQLAAEQRTKAEGETTTLGDGSFVTAAGEAWYRYQCRPLQVQARDNAFCYNALPVDVAAHNKARYLLNLGFNETTENAPTSFYVEPHTNLLNTSARQI
jgi:hypothetical protein